MVSTGNRRNENGTAMTATVTFLPAAPLTGDSFTGLYGASQPGTITVNNHSWVADQTGLYELVDPNHPGTLLDLKAEWSADYTRMLANDPTLTGIQRLEGNAEQVFENTGLNKLSATIQERDREDLQREYDAMAGALIQANLSSIAPLSVPDYLTMEHTLQGNSTLEELAVQGHGLNHEPNERYDGYTNDIQNNVDNTTLYVGPGLDHNQKAIADFLDDVVLGHAPFPTVFINGQLEQLNQNGAAEDRSSVAVEAFNQAAFHLVLTSADFSKTASTTTPATLPTLTPADPTPSTGFQTDYDGGLVPTTLSVTIPGTTTSALLHSWTADANGLFHTSTDLQTEWRNYYTIALAGGTLTAWQRMEANAEAVFENTGLSNQSKANQIRDREDIQRQIDAEWAAMQINHELYSTSLSADFTQTTYLQLEHTLQSNDQLEELALQGHGLNKPPSSRYRGYTNDIQNVVDNKTKFIGGGLDNGQKAIADFMDDVILGHLAFPAVFINGHLTQLNQNGARENTIHQAIHGLNETAFLRDFTGQNFKRG